MSGISRYNVDYASSSRRQVSTIQTKRCTCPGQEGKTYQSGSVKRYCDILESGVEGNPQMLLDIINDLKCVFDKTFGNTRSLEGRNATLMTSITSLKEQISELELCKITLQKELCRIQGELLVAQKAYEEELERRVALENMVTQLRIKLNRMEAMAEVDAKDKAELANCIEKLEARLREACDSVEGLKIEKTQLISGLQDLEGWRNRQSENVAMSKGRCSQLEEALAQCCKMNEQLQCEVAELRKERDCLQQLDDKLQCEIKRLSEEVARAEAAWAKERASFQQTITELKDTLDSQTLKNRELCDRMTKVVKAHHQEMENLKKQAEKFSRLYEQEKASKERMERAMRECEERTAHSPAFDILRKFGTP